MPYNVAATSAIKSCYCQTRPVHLTCIRISILWICIIRHERESTIEFVIELKSGWLSTYITIHFVSCFLCVWKFESILGKTPIEQPIVSFIEFDKIPTSLLCVATKTLFIAIFVLASGIPNVSLGRQECHEVYMTELVSFTYASSRPKRFKSI